MDAHDCPILFSECQRIQNWGDAFRALWFRAAILCASAVGLGWLLAHRGFFADDMRVAYRCAGLVMLIATCFYAIPRAAAAQLHVHVSSCMLTIRYSIVRDHHIRVADIMSADPCEYRPWRDYLGHGRKYALHASFRSEIAYTFRGTKGVMLRLRDGRRVLIGTQCPSELAEAVRKATNADAVGHPR